MNPRHMTLSNHHPGRLSFPFKGGIHFVPPEQIIRLEADSNYTYIHLLGRKPILMAKVLSAYEALLLPFGFIRTHRSHLVNKRHIQHYDTSGCIIMDDDSKAEVSRRRRREVVQVLLHSHTAA